MLNKRFFTLLTAVALIFTCSVPAFAVEPSQGNTSDVVEPRLNYHGVVNLRTDEFVTIVTDYNLFDQYLTIISDRLNPGDVFVRVVNGDGQIVIGSTRVSPGDDVMIGPIPMSSGHYILEGIAVSVSDRYSFTIRD